MNLQTIITETSNKENNSINVQIEKLKNEQELYTNKVVELQSKLPSIETAISEYGLDISEFRYHHIFNDKNEIIFQISITAIPAKKCKAKFKTFKGYTKRGDTTNHKFLNNQEDLLFNHLKNNIESPNIQVNKCCFELEEKQNSKSILISIII